MLLVNAFKAFTDNLIYVQLYNYSRHYLVLNENSYKVTNYMAA